MGLSDLNFAKGFSDGMNTGLTLLEHVDRKKQREIAQKREEVRWQDAREDRRHTLDVLRPRDARIAELKMRDLEGSITHRENLRPTQLESAQLGVEGQRIGNAGGLQQLNQNADLHPMRLQSAQLGVEGQRIGNAGGLQQLKQSADLHPMRLESAQLGVEGQRIGNAGGLQQLNQNAELHPMRLQSVQLGVLGQEQGQRIQSDQHGWAKEDRPLQKEVQRWHFGQMKSQESRAKGQARRQEQMHNLKLAQQQYVSALKAYEAGDVEQAVNLMMEADDKSGGLYGNFVAGVHGKMATLAHEVSTGKRSLNDPEFIAASREFTRPSMRTSGRDPDYEFSGIATGRNGQMAYAMQPKSMGAIVGRMIQLESGGKASAKNPRSSATGAGQFIDSTWLDMIKRHKPALAKKHSDTELLKLRTDQHLSKEMMTKYAEDNAKQLNAKGVPVNAATIYLAHHFGIGGPREAGAIQLLQADPRTPIERVLPPRVIKANPYLEGKTTGDLVQGITQKMSVPATHGMSGDDDDPLITKDQQDMISEVQTGAVLEQQFLNNTPAPILQALRQRLAGTGVTDNKTKSIQQWNKLSDSTLYNRITGETKSVAPEAGDINPKHVDALTGLLNYQGVSALINSELAHLPATRRQSMVDDAMKSGGKTATELYQMIEAPKRDEAVKGLSQQVVQGFDIEEARAAQVPDDLIMGYQQVTQQAKQLIADGLLDEQGVKQIVSGALETVDQLDHAGMVKRLQKDLKSIQKHVDHEKAVNQRLDEDFGEGSYLRRIADQPFRY